MQGTMQKTSKRRAPRSEYTSQNQLSFTGFETPFYNGLDPENCWVVLSSQIPWDELILLFNKRNPPQKNGEAWVESPGVDRSSDHQASTEYG